MLDCARFGSMSPTKRYDEVETAATTKELLEAGLDPDGVLGFVNDICTEDEVERSVIVNCVG